MQGSYRGLARRLRRLRRELVGEHGGPLLAEQLGMPYRTWSAFEAGRPVPAAVLLRLAQIAEVDPQWLVSGQGDGRLRGDGTRLGPPPRPGPRD